MSLHMKTYIYFATFILISSQSFASSDPMDIDDVQDNRPKAKIVELLENEAYYSKIFQLLEHDGMNPLSEAFEDIKKLRKDYGEKVAQFSKYAVRIKNKSYQSKDHQGGHYVTLADYLNDPWEDRIVIDYIDSYKTLVKERPADFKTLVLKSIPKTQDDIEQNLESYYRETMKIDQLINDLPRYDDPRVRLVAFIFESVVRGQVRSEALAQIFHQFGDQIGDPEVLVQESWDHLGLEIARHVWLKIGKQVRKQISLELLPLVKSQVLTQFKDQFGADLSSTFDFTSLSDSEDMKNLLKQVINYTLVAYQLASIPLMHSSGFETIQIGHETSQRHRFAAWSLINSITEERAENILASIPLPEAAQGDYLAESQIKILKRHLAN